MKLQLTGHVKAMSLLAPDKLIVEVSLPAALAQAALTLFVPRSEGKFASPGDTVDLTIEIYDPSLPRAA